MTNIIFPPDWAIPSSETTPEDIFRNRRRFLRKAGLAAAGMIGGAMIGSACAQETAPESRPAAGGVEPLASGQNAAARGVDPSGPVPRPAEGLYPAGRNAAFSELDRPLTPEEIAASHNNFYEFANGQTDRFSYQRIIAERSKDYPFRPWQVEVTGLCEKPRTFTIDELEALASLEERLYRFRCVEAWSMAVPWTGYPLARLLDAVVPKSAAKYVSFTSWLDRSVPGVKGAPNLPWPYYEGLRLDEAMNDLTLLCTGVYGKALPGQHGAPVRIVCPWKYGYKNPKSIARIELTDRRGGTFWNDLQASEYGYYSNVDPGRPHPRWSQATEWMIPDKGTRRPTLLYNGYGNHVASMYEGDEI